MLTAAPLILQENDSIHTHGITPGHMSLRSPQMMKAKPHKFQIGGSLTSKKKDIIE